MRGWLAALALLTAAPAAATSAPDLRFDGTITGQKAQTYQPVPFDVPAGVERITVTLTYDKSVRAGGSKTVLDMGVWDPARFRGWSGGTRDRFTLSASDATPGYLRGPLPAGRWQVMLGVPNAAPGSSAAYHVEVFFDHGTDRHASEAIADPPLKPSPGWYRGDLHMHDAASDGSCVSQSGKRVPCPLFRTIEAAAARGLDFVAVTDHNTDAHWDGLRELQPWFDRTLLIPGTEITTFKGHANIFGPRHWVDFRGDIRAIEREAAAAGAILSINHPNSPTGAICMGCGWTWPDTDYAGVTAIEAINGTTVQGPLSGPSFWYARLNEGHRLTGIGGSDSHDPDAPDGKPPVGTPTTVVHADALSMPAILDGIRAGDVFIDVEGTRDRLLEVEARSGPAKSVMGGRIAPQGAVTLAVHARAVAGGRVEIVANGEPLPSLARTIARPDERFDIVLPTTCGWASVNIQGKTGPLLIGNPVWIDCRR